MRGNSSALKKRAAKEYGLRHEKLMQIIAIFGYFLHNGRVEK